MRNVMAALVFLALGPSAATAQSWAEKLFQDGTAHDFGTVHRGARWAVVLIHERRLVARVRVRTGSGSRAFSLRRTIADWPGRDTVVVRALGPRGEICRAAVVLDEEVSD